MHLHLIVPPKWHPAANKARPHLHKTSGTFAGGFLKRFQGLRFCKTWLSLAFALPWLSGEWRTLAVDCQWRYVQWVARGERARKEQHGKAR